MKLKYYLRGLGIGIIVTAVVMGVASGNQGQTLSDREIRERAAELGMVEQSGSLAELAQEENGDAPEMSPELSKASGELEADETPDAVAEKTPDKTPTAAAEETPNKTPDTAAEETPDKTPDAAAEEMPDETPTATREPAEAASTVAIEIKSGDGSYTVCQRLEQEGLIASAAEFDTYLYQNGYDRKLRVGSYEIPADAKPEEIAKILCGIQ